MFMERRLTNQQLKPRNELENQLVAIWQEVLGVPQVSILDSFFELGGTSLQAARLFAAIEKTFSKNLPLATLFQAPTIEQLAEILNQEDEAVSWNSLVTIQPNGSKPPLFCVHGAGGNVLMYRSLVDYLGSDQPLYGLQARGLDGKGNLVTQVKEMAKLYIQEIRELQPEGPYCLAGLSLGGIIAFEMAQLLQAQGQEVALLAMIDSHGPGYPKLLPLVPRLWQSLPRVALYLLGRLPYRVKHLIKQRTQREDALFASPVEHNLAEPISKIDNQRESINQEVIDKLSNNGEMIDDSRLLPQQMNSLQDQLDYFSLWILKFTPWSFFVVKFYLDNGRSLSDPLQKVQESNVKAMLSYKPQIYPGRAVLFRATEQPPGCYYDRCLGWQELIADGIEIHDVPGYHNESLLAKEKTLRIIGNQLKGYLDKVSPASK
jgi:thioesterase domain-containing protein/acyl carrier protein